MLRSGIEAMPRAKDNVLFITADQMRADCLSALGHPAVKTPNLDRLAAEGLLFAEHYAQSVPCGPARASLYCGLYQHKHRLVVNGAPLDARHSNVALEARKLGYDPVLFGYTDIAPDPRPLPPGDPALTSYEGILPGMTPALPLTGELDAWRADLQKKGYELPERDGEFTNLLRPRPGHDGPGPTFAPAFYKAEDSNTAFVTDAVLDHIAGAGAAPWFIHLSYLAPHPPFIVPEPYHCLYDAADIEPPLRRGTAEAEATQHPFLAEAIFHPQGSGLTQKGQLRDHLSYDPAALRQAKATYYGMISEVDFHIGRLIEALKAQGRYERTLIVFTSDHGEQLGDHWLFGKTCYFEASYRIPLIVRDPRPKASKQFGSRISAFTEAVDVMPTILDWLGAVPPRACDGHSLLPFLQGEQPDETGARKPVGSSISAALRKDAETPFPASHRKKAPWSGSAARATSWCTSPSCPRSFSICRKTPTSLPTWPEILRTARCCWRKPKGSSPGACRKTSGPSPTCASHPKAWLRSAKVPGGSLRPGRRSGEWHGPAPHRSGVRRRQSRR